MLKMITWNINGIRAIYKKNFLDFLEEESPDFICLQEIKIQEEQLQQNMLTPPGYDSFYSFAKRPGYSGVCIFYKKKHKAKIISINKLGKAIFDDEGRTLILELPKFFLFCCYFPNGQRDHARVPYKMKYCKAIEEKALKLHKETSKEIIITGDLNTAHHAIDLKNPKSNQKTTGFLPIERAWHDKMLGKNNFLDVFRSLNPQTIDEYTWWTYRNNCRERNIGWRIDYFLASDGLKKKIKNCHHLTQIVGSDHCPVVLEISS